jgi:site-specific DNA-methyltransferase (adenine-specific)
MKITEKIEVTNEDNMELMARYPDKYFDLAIVDPPYGIGASKRIGTTYKKGVLKNKKGFGNKKLYSAKKWDNEVPTAKYWNELFRVSKNQIVWGGNYFTQYLPESRGWVYWDKKIINHQIDNYSDGELAWTSFDCVLRKFTYDWIGLGYCNSTEKGTRIHSTQKPVALYKWLLDKYAKDGDKILDTHLGSGSIAIACHDYGFELTACELDTEYYEKAVERINNHVAQLTLF